LLAKKAKLAMADKDIGHSEKKMDGNQKAEKLF